jgi:hypothetical protein
MTDISLSGFSLQLLYGEELKCIGEVHLPFTMAWLELTNGSRIVLTDLRLEAYKNFNPRKLEVR